jgi:hypothetical protein
MLMIGPSNDREKALHAARFVARSITSAVPLAGAGAVT